VKSKAMLCGGEIKTVVVRQRNLKRTGIPHQLIVPGARLSHGASKTPLKMISRCSPGFRSKGWDGVSGPERPP